jgi:sugar lactone lactonase YvrE
MSLWKKIGKPAEASEKTGSNVSTKAGEKAGGFTRRPRIEQVSPRAAIPGGQIEIWGSSFSENGRSRPVVRFGEQSGGLMISSPKRLVVRVPEGVTSGELTVESDAGVSAPVPVSVGRVIAENLHPVANPAIDEAGNIYVCFSGSRGQQVPVSVYKIDREHRMKPFVTDLMNATGLAFDREGQLYISSRNDGTVTRVSPQGRRMVFAEGMGIATGLAFDQDGNLYVGDRSGTIFKISRDQQIFVFATLEPSMAAYHLAFGPEGYLYVTGPTTSSYDHVFRISPAGEVASFYRGLGRPQGLAFDVDGNLYVAASIGGQQGVVRFSTRPEALGSAESSARGLKGRSRGVELAISGNRIVGLAFTRHRSLLVATDNSLIEVPIDIEGRPLL